MKVKGEGKFCDTTNLTKVSTTSLVQSWFILRIQDSLIIYLWKHKIKMNSVFDLIILI